MLSASWRIYATEMNMGSLSTDDYKRWPKAPYLKVAVQDEEIISWQPGFDNAAQSAIVTGGQWIKDYQQCEIDW